MKEKLVLFSDKYSPEEYDKKPLPCQIFNNEGAVLAPKGAKIGHHKLLNCYIKVSEDFKILNNTVPETNESENIQTDDFFDLPDVDIDLNSIQDAGFKISANYKEEDTTTIVKRIDKIDFAAMPDAKYGLKTNVSKFKEIFKKQIDANNKIKLATKDNYNVSREIANHLDTLLEDNQTASDYIEMVNSIRNSDNYISFSHGCAVSFYVMAIAKKLQMIREDFYIKHNIGKWVSIKTRKNNKFAGSLRLSSQLLKYIDGQKHLIMAKYRGSERDAILENLYDIMHAYGRIDPERKYQSLLVDYSASLREQLAVAALNSDIGKICIPNHILNKPEKLSNEEWSEMQKHPVYSVAKLKESGVNAPMVFAYIICHHIINEEKKYPNLNNPAPIEAKIIAVSDIYDAMRSPKNYGKVHSQNEALSYINQLYKEKSFDLPLYLAAVHTFQEFNHSHIKKRIKEMITLEDKEE